MTRYPIDRPTMNVCFWLVIALMVACAWERDAAGLALSAIVALVIWPR